MKKNHHLFILMLVLFMAGCQKDIQPSAEQNISEEPMAKATSAGNTTINLSVEVDDLTEGNKILSDGGGLYSNGTDRVQAQILSSDGNFFMNTNNTSAKLPLRTIHFSFGSPELNLNDPNNRNYSLRTSAAIPLQNMGDGDEQLVGFRVWAFQQQGAIAWKLLFRMGIEDYSGSLTDYARVTRNGDVWTIEPANYPGITPANATLTDGNSPANPIAQYIVPFKLTLTKIGR